MTRKEFEDRWLNVHAPIAADFPDLRGYVLSFSVEEGEPEADGVAQLWFDNRNSVQQSYASEIGREGSSDARQYLARRDHLLVSERWIGRPEASAGFNYKLMIGLKRAVDTKRDKFLASMATLDAAMLRDSLNAQTVRVCVDEEGKQLNSGVDGELSLFESEAVFDALIEAWYHDLETLQLAQRRFQGSEPAKRLVMLTSAHETFQLFENVVVAPPEQVQPAALLTITA